MYITKISDITNSGIEYLWKSEKGTVQNEGSIDWAEIHTADAFKRDLFGYDLICLQLSKKDEDEGIEVDEEDPKWNELMIELPKNMGGFKEWTSWFSEVAFPAFEANLTRVYERNERKLYES